MVELECTDESKASPQPAVEVEIVRYDALNLAMAHSGVPLLPSVRIRNTGVHSLVGAKFVVHVGPDLGDAHESVLPTLRPGEDWEPGPVEVPLPHERLRSITESETGWMHLSVTLEGKHLFEQKGELRLLAFNEWAGCTAPSSLLAVFVTPNRPAVTRVLKAAREVLARDTGDDSFQGYQLGSPERVLAQVRAVYQAVQELGISYIGVPPSFEGYGQRVRLPEQLLEESMGNCLDLTLLFAACLERMSLHPLLVLIEGHAFPAVWLEDNLFQEGTIDDAARVRNQIQLGRLLAFDSSTCVAGPRPPFEDAIDEATVYVADDEQFRVAIDVRAARTAKYRPLPLRMTIDAVAEAEVEGALETGQTESLDDDCESDTESPSESARHRLPDPTPRETDPVKRRLAKWSALLLDSSTRNRLLNFRTDRGIIPLRVPDLAEFENKLASEVDFDIIAEPNREAGDQRAEQLVAKREAIVDDFKRLLTAMEKHRLHTTLEAQKLLPTAKKISREARTDLEEGGANTLFAVVGVLKWFESESSQLARHAPLLLVPVKLDYDPRRDRVVVRRTDDDAIGNVTLVEKMKTDFGVDLSLLKEPPLDEQGVDVPLVLRRTREAIQRMRRWEVVEDACIGQFKFGKFLMWVDLEANKDTLLRHDLVRHLARGVRDAFPDRTQVPSERSFDDEVPPTELPTVVDADSTQLKAVLAALRGRSFVLQGPPGTGKSQTITNLIAAALAQKRTVLFVSEKMAALDVVHRRLKQAGLADFCLELHSHKANKKQILESLGRAVEGTSRGSDNGFDRNAKLLAETRGRLNAYARSLHEPRPIGLTFYRACARDLELRAQRALNIPLPEGVQLKRARYEQLLAAADELRVPASRIEPVASHPWADTPVATWSGALESSLRDCLTTVSNRLTDIEAAGSTLAKHVECGSELSLDALDDLATTVAALRSQPVPSVALSDEWSAVSTRIESFIALISQDELARADLAKRWRDEVFDVGDEVGELRVAFESFGRSNPITRFFKLRAPFRTLKPLVVGALPAPERIAKDLSAVEKCMDRAMELAGDTNAASVLGFSDGSKPTSAGARASLDYYRSTRDAMARCAPGVREALGRIASATSATGQSRREEAARAGVAVTEAVTRLREAMHAAAERMQSPAAWPAPSTPAFLSETRRAVAARMDALPMLRSWCSYFRAAESAREVGLVAVVEAHRQGEIRAADLVRVVERSILSQWIELIRDAEPVLRDFDGDVHSERVRAFRQHDADHIKLSRGKVVSVLEAARPARLGGDLGESEMGILHRELKKKRRHLALRKLFQAIPALLPRLKPCFLMSPLSVAQYLPPGGKKFDLVVFDEASQIGTHDAIGAIARGAQVVIVGDSKQLPPTAFFARSTADDEVEEEGDVADLESILDEAIAGGMPEQSLGWHYRSRHQSLIEFSNRHYYGDLLNVFPAARGRVPELGVKWHYLPDGVYLFGKDRTNPVEARALVDWLVTELKQVAPGTRTFGIVAFSMAQQTLLQDYLDEARKKTPEIEGHFSPELDESIFVKNLENVQGDERDEILFSIGYGPAEDRKVRMNFGPLSRSGGERRLNVAITRARSQLRVFSSLTHHQIDPARTQATGAHHLRAFLRFAEEQGTATPENAIGSQEHDSQFEVEVCDALTLLGYDVEAQVGCGGYRIDLGVRHPKQPGVFVLAVECDGAAYHSGATARDRDRLRQSVLENLGWRVHRVWSTDWWFERERETEKLREAVERAIAAVDAGAPTVRAVEPAGPQSPASVPLVRTELPDAFATALAKSPGAVEMPEAVAEAPHDTPPMEIYSRAVLPQVSTDSDAMLDPRNERKLWDAILRVAQVEGPIAEEVLARQVTRSFGGQKVGSRFRAAIQSMLRSLEAAREVQLRDGFVWPRTVDPASYNRMRGATVSGDLRGAEEIAIEELAACAAWYLEHAHSMPPRDLVRLTARAFGFQRVGKDVEGRIGRGIDLLVERGTAAMTTDGRVEWKAKS